MQQILCYNKNVCLSQVFGHKGAHVETMKKLFAAMTTAILCVAIGLLPAAASSAAVSSAQASSSAGTVGHMEEDFLEFTVPAGMYAFNKSTSPTDPNLAKVGLAETWHQKQQDLSRMGDNTTLILPEGGAYTINITAKASTFSSDYYDMRSLSDAQFQTLLSDLAKPEKLSDGSETQNTTKRYDSPTLPFIHIVSRATVNGKNVVDEGYFTIMNGKGYTVETYRENGELTAEQSAALKSIADSIRFTKIVPKPSAAQTQADNIKIILLLLSPVIIIVLIIVAVVVSSKVRRRKNRRRQAMVLEKLSAYRQAQNALEEKAAASGTTVPEPETLLENTTKCTTKVLKKFGWMDLLLNRRSSWIPLSIACIVLIVLGIVAAPRSPLVCVICLVAAVICLIPPLRLPRKTFQTENGFFRKAKTRKRRYQFRAEDFRVTDVTSTVYPYVQLVEVRETKDFFYLYLSEKHVFVVAKKSFTKGTPEDLRRLLDEKRIHF